MDENNNNTEKDPEQSFGQENDEFKLVKDPRTMIGKFIKKFSKNFS